ncbi:uncharacterized protein LOC113516161 [Galleria mellonella]|uniref:Uncharacterized protein LOC113516161 n=1 Tax=Galleria mellonella TaxID=7137 RepID=A0A6J1WV81_GALME|nr:uncharacterized protein LOC113516161 [Galleria mellonella]
MALDKQRILSELGSVVNQLQSADCGCMGKLFSNPCQGTTTGASLPTCDGYRRGCCHGHHQGYSSPCAGEPCSNMNSMNYSMNQPCMGQCNPPKLYADTYNYLNKNLMQPTIKEVYNDLKTITPANTIMNNPMARQLGLSQGYASMPAQSNMVGTNQTSTLGGSMNQNNAENMGGMSVGYSLQMDNSAKSQQMGNMQNVQSPNQTNQPPRHMSQPMGYIGGMGAQIVNMMTGDSGSKNRMSGQVDQLVEPIQSNTSSSLNVSGYSTGIKTMDMNYGQQNHSNLQSPVSQYPPKLNVYPKDLIHSNQISNYMTQNNLTSGSHGVDQISNMEHVNWNPAVQQISAPNPNIYGQHTPGITKFNEMFPGVKQGGDLGFDPMAIAIQMNPANQQKAAMDTIQKLMTGNGTVRDSNPAVIAANAANINIPQGNNMSMHANNQMLNQKVSDQQVSLTSHITNRSQPVPQLITNPNKMINNQISHQQNYATQQIQQHQQQKIVEPNTNAMIHSLNLLDGNETIENLNAQTQRSMLLDKTLPPSTSIPMPKMTKEPIFPVNASRNQTIYTNPQKTYQYNTLGQPIQMMSAKMYHSSEPPLPQTLSPQPLLTKPRNQMKYSNVKNTISKTSIAGNRAVGKTPSRSQLQQIYNQYKGSQSFTQQNIKPYSQAYDNGLTYSEGNVTHRIASPPHQTPIVEKVGGDTIANKALININAANKVKQIMEQIGDVPATKPCEDNTLDKATPIKQSKLRNGLQDMVYTSYPTSTAWSFHGNRAPLSPGYRYKAY